MDSLKNIMSDCRIFMYGGVRTLPLTIAGTMIVLGLMTANYAMLFFLLGFLIAVPAIVSALNIIAEFIVPSLGLTSWFTISCEDVCTLVIPFVTSVRNSPTTIHEIGFSTHWMAMTIFFFSYLLTNAVELLTKPSAESVELEVNTTDAPDIVEKAANRKTQAIISIASIAIIALVLILYRLFATRCESKLGFIITLSVFGTLGYYWYQLLSSTGRDCLSDLFGIANRLLPPNAITNAPIACVPVPA